jgi:hypothetical protein
MTATGWRRWSPTATRTGRRPTASTKSPRPDHETGGRFEQLGLFQADAREFAGAEKLFTEALTYEPGLFTAKNNLVLARAAQRKYDLPVVEMTQTERAELLYTAGAGRDQAGRRLGRQGPVAAGHRHPSHLFRRRRPQPGRAGRQCEDLSHADRPADAVARR